MSKNNPEKPGHPPLLSIGGITSRIHSGILTVATSLVEAEEKREHTRTLTAIILSQAKQLGKGSVWIKSGKTTLPENLEKEAGFSPKFLYKIPQPNPYAGHNVPILLLTEEPLPIPTLGIIGPIPIEVIDSRRTGPAKNNIRQITVPTEEITKGSYSRAPDLHFQLMGNIIIAKEGQNPLTPKELIDLLI